MRGGSSTDAREYSLASSDPIPNTEAIASVLGAVPSPAGGCSLINGVKLKRILIWSILALASFEGSVAEAHAVLDRANPAVGSTVHGSPDQVKLWISEEIEPEFSSIRIFDADGKQVDKGAKAVSLADKTLITVSVPNLSPGTYKVVWQVVSVDTHKTEGHFTFRVALS
jgi:methionine-rich copper-binding protein CopC